MSEKLICKVDLHVHSQYSEIEGGILKKITHSESYTPPQEVYKIAKKRGMNFVTITDHNSIRGPLEIAHHDDVFISEEVTVTFPEDKCEIHVVTLNINEYHHQNISKLRHNIYDLVDYLNSNQIVHFVAHPFSSVNGKLRKEHWEKMLLLFDVFEVRNGVQREKDNLLLEKILKGLTAEKIHQLIDKYKIYPLSQTPWKKSMVGGSDDHGGLYIGKTYTVGRGPGLADFLESIRRGETKAEGKSGTFHTVGHSIYATGYKFYKYRLKKRKLFKFIDKFVTDEIKGKILEKAFFKNGSKLSSIMPKGFLISFFIKKFSKKMPFLYTLRTMGKINKNLPLYAALSPYLFGLAYQNKDRNLTWEVKKYYLDQPDPLKIAIFTDILERKDSLPHHFEFDQTLFEREKIKIISCNRKIKSSNVGIKIFRSVADFPFPIFPDIHLYIPPLLEILSYCEKEDFALIHVLTPGPMGLAGIMVSKLLKIPLIGTYYIDFSKHIQKLITSENFKNLVWKYLGWYYSQMHKIIVTSEKYLQELKEKNISPTKLKFLPCEGIDQYICESSSYQFLKDLLHQENFFKLREIYKEIYV